MLDRFSVFFCSPSIKHTWVRFVSRRSLRIGLRLSPLVAVVV